MTTLLSRPFIPASVLVLLLACTSPVRGGTWWDGFSGTMVDGDVGDYVTARPWKSSIALS